MPRPCKVRRVDCGPRVMSFKPCGVTRHTQATVSLTLDELEAVRLADLEGLYQEQAAVRMKVSRQTFGNIIASAHKKIADFLVNSKHLAIGGGSVKVDQCKFRCRACGHTWSIACEDDRPRECPCCASGNFGCAKKKGTTTSTCWRNL